MKPRPSLRSFLALSGSAMLLVPQSQAAYYYWDTNGNTAGFGDTAGTWGSSAFLALVNAPNGRGIIGGTLATAATVLTSNDSINFGTINLGLTGAATTIGTTGTLNINNITFGFGQAEPVTLSGGGIITMGGSNPVIYVNNAPGTIAAEVAGTAGMNKAGPGILTLTGANTYTGTTNAPLNTGSNDAGYYFGGTEYARYDTTAGYFRAVTYGVDNNASAIVGTGATLKEGAGTLTLSGANTFNFTLPGGTPAVTAGVAIRAGTLSVGSLNSVVSHITT